MIGELIGKLDDRKAVRVLRAIGKAKMRGGKISEAEWTRELEGELRREFASEDEEGQGEAVSVSVSEGELARQALLVLAEDAKDRPAIEAMVKNPPAESFVGVDPLSVGVIVAALVALQTSVIIERDKAGKVRFKIEKKPARDSLLQALVKKWLQFPSS